MKIKTNNRPKVGIFTRPIDQGTSGSGSHLRQLINHILDINDEFNIVLLHHTKNNNEIYKKTNQLIISMNPLLSFRKLRRENFDILHFSPLSIISPFWLRRPKKFATIHGGGAFYLPENYNKLKLFRFRFIRPILARKMNYIFTVSRTTKQDIIINRFHVEKEKIIITHNATNEEFRVLENKPQIAFEKFGVNGPFIFHLSKFSVRKNPWTIIKAFKILKSENKNIKLVLGGKGWKNRDVIDYARNNGLDKDIVFTGFISQSEMIELLNLAKIFVFPSLFEGFGIPNIEAMACGCPVITSNSFAIPEIVGDAAIILKDKRDPVELAKKMKMILEDDNLRKSLINKGLKQAKLYSWNKSANIVLNTYKKCLNMD